jgi:hypothetical protein
MSDRCVGAARRLLALGVVGMLSACGGESPASPTSTQATATTTIPATPPTPMTSVSITHNTPNPAPAGSTFKVTAAGTGGTTPYQFKYVVVAGGNRTTVQNWSGNPSYEVQAWGISAQRYEVWGRSAGFTDDSAQVTAAFDLTTTPAPSGSGIIGITSSGLLPPRPAGQPVTFTAYATGGKTPYQFKWFIDSSIAQDWSASPSFTWTSPQPGLYNIVIWGRSAGATADTPEATMTLVPYRILPTTTPYMTAIKFGPITKVADPAGGTRVTITLSGEGGVPPYQFRVVEGGVFDTKRVLRDWSNETSLTWTAPASTKYVELEVFGRSAGSTNSAGEIGSGLSFPVP